MTTEIQLIDGGVSSSELAPIAPSDISAADFDHMVKEAAAKAKTLTDIITQQSKAYVVDVHGHQFLKYEAWATIAAGFGAQAGVDSYEVLKNTEGYPEGVRATAIVRNLKGEQIGSAPGFCMMNELGWSGRTLAQVASMAGTRAASKALRLAFSWVVVMAGYDPTPYEEIDDEAMKAKIGNQPRPSAPNRTEKPVQAPVAAKVVSGSADPPQSGEICPLHGVAWGKAKEKDGRSWFSHQYIGDNDEPAWCNEGSVRKAMAAAAVTKPEPIPEPEPEPVPEPVPADVAEEGEEALLDEANVITGYEASSEEELAKSLAEKAGIPWEEFVSDILGTDSWAQFQGLGGNATIAATRLKKIKGGK